MSCAGLALLIRHFTSTLTPQQVPEFRTAQSPGARSLERHINNVCVWLVLFCQIFGAGCAFQAPEQTRSLGRQRRQTLFRLNMYKDVHSVCWPVAAGVVCFGAVVSAAAPERVQLEQTAASPGHGRGPW